MRNLSFLLLLSAIMLAGACGHRPDVEQKKLWDEMMAVHDEAMPLMSDIKRVSRGLKAEILYNDSLSVFAPDWHKRADSALARLEAADKAMWDWMGAINEKKQGAGADHEAVMQILGKEKEEIERIYAEMKVALEEGEQVLGEAGSKSEKSGSK